MYVAIIMRVCLYICISMTFGLSVAIAMYMYNSVKLDNNIVS